MNTQWKSRITFFLIVLLSSAVTIIAVPKSRDNVWTQIDKGQLIQPGFDSSRLPRSYETFHLNKAGLQSILDRAPEEFRGESSVILSLPMPDGTYGRFRIEHSLVVERGLLIKYPELGATYRGQGIDDPTATARFDLLPSGFHAIVLSPEGTIYIDPYTVENSDDYISTFKHDRTDLGNFHCMVDEGSFDSLLQANAFKPTEFVPETTPEVTNGTQLRTYRLALAASNEYCVAVGGNTTAGCLAAQVLIMNRVNGVYEKDLAIRMNIIANNNLIVYAGDNMSCGGACNSGNDPYTNNNPSALLNENQANCDAVIGTANYDIGHVFSTGGGGVATLGGPCNLATKARGETGLPQPLGDPFAIDFVAHEMGHQFAARHTFNGSTGNCTGGNRTAGSAYEPGSGITIMAYAGICGAQDLSDHSIDKMGVKSLEDIVAFKEAGGSCGPATATGNTPPVPTGPGNFTIPKTTPFALTASATDVNGDSLTYSWEEYDLGPVSPPDTDADGMARPLFRPYLPLASGTHTFPSLTYILNNANVPPMFNGLGFLTGEILPSISRTMTFQVVVRDNRANGGGINTATSALTVSGTSGPFNVTSPNTGVSYAGLSSQNVTWNVAGTSGAPVNAANVKISMSTDGGNTFPTVLAASTANDGTETVTIPNTATLTARIKVEAVGNIFFDISDANFMVTAATPKVRADFDGDGKTDLSVFRPAAGAWYVQQSTAGFTGVGFGAAADALVPGDYDGDGKTDYSVFRAATGSWYILRSTLGFTGANFGLSTDLPVQGDYDGDGKTDIAVFRPATGTWYLSQSAAGFTGVQFGTNNDKPVPADYDGDGKTDIAVYRPTTSTWYLLRSTLGFTSIQFGINTDKVVPADYDGDGKADIAVFRDAVGTWYRLNSNGGAFFFQQFGSSGDIPTPGDYDGDGKTDLSVFRPSNNNWYRLNSNGGAFVANLFGANGDKPVPASYVPLQ